jgi:acyl-coenzyme A synthetase/AMP-(fatty) acid ligase
MAERGHRLARPRLVMFIPEPPKSRSGRTMRRRLPDLAEDLHPSTVRTKAHPSEAEQLA